MYQYVSISVYIYISPYRYMYICPPLQNGIYIFFPAAVTFDV